MGLDHFGIALANRTIHSTVDYQSVESGSNLAETIPDEQVPLAAPQTQEAAEFTVPVVIMPQEEIPVVHTDNQETAADATPTPTPEPVTESPATPTPEPDMPSNRPAEPTDEPKETPAEEPTPMLMLPTLAPEEPTPTPSEPTPSPAPVKAQKPADIKDTVSMAKYLFDAATEFWAVVDCQQ